MNLHELLDKHGVPFRKGGEHRNVRDSWIGLDCPWCSIGSEKFHLGVHLPTLATTCWRCGRHRLGDTLSLVLRLSLPHILDLLKDIPRTPTARFRGRSGGGVLEYPRGVGPLLNAHLAYLRGRGFDPPTLERLWGVRGLGLTPRLGWRLWIPVHLDGRIVSWTTRAIGDKGTRYVHAKPEQEAIPIKSLLYGWDHVRRATMVVEGPTDAWRIGPGAVAVMGLQVTADQLELIGRVPRRIVCFDSEPAAQKRAGKLCRLLTAFPGETRSVELKADDPGEAGEEEVAQLRKMLE